MARSMYWWADYKVPRASLSNKKSRAEKAFIRATAGRQTTDGAALFPADTQWSEERATNDVGVQKGSTLHGFVSFFGKGIGVCLFWAVACAWMLIGYGSDFCYLGIGALLYFTLLIMGLVVSIGLPIKWYREYRDADGYVVTTNDAT